MHFDDQNYLLRLDIISNIDFFFLYQINTPHLEDWCNSVVQVALFKEMHSAEPCFLKNSRKTLLMSFTLRLYIIVLYDIDYFAGKSSIFLSKKILNFHPQ